MIGNNVTATEGAAGVSGEATDSPAHSPFGAGRMWLNLAVMASRSELSVQRTFRRARLRDAAGSAVIGGDG